MNDLLVFVFFFPKFLLIIQIKKKLEPLPEPEDGTSNCDYLDPGQRSIDNCTIFLGFTSNMISSGVRETIKYLVKNNMVGIHIVAALNGLCHKTLATNQDAPCFIYLWSALLRS